MERALEQSNTYDYMRNYAFEQQVSKMDSSAFSCKALVPYEDSTLEGRPIMDMMWSPHVNELYVVAYGAKPPLKEIMNNRSSSAPPLAASADDDIPGMVCYLSNLISIYVCLLLILA